jgi:hypothetical protein
MIVSSTNIVVIIIFGDLTICAHMCLCGCALCVCNFMCNWSFLNFFSNSSINNFKKALDYISRL